MEGVNSPRSGREIKWRTEDEVRSGLDSKYTSLATAASTVISTPLDLPALIMTNESGTKRGEDAERLITTHAASTRPVAYVSGATAPLAHCVTFTIMTPRSAASRKAERSSGRVEQFPAPNVCSTIHPWSSIPS